MALRFQIEDRIEGDADSKISREAAWRQRLQEATSVHKRSADGGWKTTLGRINALENLAWDILKCPNEPSILSIWTVMHLLEGFPNSTVQFARE